MPHLVRNSGTAPDEQRSACARQKRADSGKTSIAIAPPIRNSQARGGLMKNAFSEAPVAISQMLSASEAPPMMASAIGSADRLPFDRRTAAHSIGGKAR